MLRIETYREQYFKDKVDAWMHQPLTIDDRYFDAHATRYLIYCDGTAIGMAGIIYEGKSASFQYFIGNPEYCYLKYGRQIVAIITNKLIKEGIDSITTKANDNNHYIQTLKHNMYYLRGEYYQRVVEPYRRLIPDAAFDDSGYIINQGLMDKVPFGHFKSREKGCGFIAAYNLCKLFGNERRLKELSKNIGNKALFGGIIGANLFQIKHYLNKLGIPVKYYVTNKANAQKKIANTTMGIILYFHLKGGHYVAYTNLGSNQYHFYNGVYGKANHVDTIDNYLEKYAKYPLIILLGIPK